MGLTKANKVHLHHMKPTNEDACLHLYDVKIARLIMI